MRVSSRLSSSLRIPPLVPSLRWAGVLVDSAGLYVERVSGPGHARWTVRLGERGAVVLEPESYLDGDRSDFPVRSLRGVRVDHEARHRDVVVFDRSEGEVRLVCRDPAAAARVVARCRALREAGDPPAAVDATPTARQRPGGRRR